MKLETRLRNRRRSAQLRDATKAREEQLDQLRSQLSRELVDFEGRLEAALAEIPDWADVDVERLAGLLEVQIGSDRFTLGPRVVASAASSVETFVRDWLSSVAIDPDEGAAPAQVERWAEDLAALRERLDRVRTAAREAASAAEKKLGEQLEEVLGNLEDERESHEGALLKQVEGGEVGAGQDARKKEASLWEEQRERAAHVREAWTPLEELVFEGVDIAVAGVGQMEALVDGVAIDMGEAYPELADATHVASGVRLRKFSVPPPLPQLRDASSPSFPVDDARRETEPLSPYETQEFARELLASSHDTDPPQTAATAVSEPPPLPVRKRERVPTLPPPVPKASAAVSTGHRVLDETTHRIRSGWQPVRLVEAGLVLCPPLLYTLILLAWSIVHHLGFASNPFQASDVTLPLWLGCAACVFILPAVLGWRVIWSEKWQPRFVRWQRRREDTVLRLDGEGLQLGDNRLKWENASVVLRKASRVEPTWVLEVDAPHVHLFFAAEANANEWTQRRVAESTGVPLNAWRISEETLLEIVQRVGL